MTVSLTRLSASSGDSGLSWGGSTPRPNDVPARMAIMANERMGGFRQAWFTKKGPTTTAGTLTRETNSGVVGRWISCPGSLYPYRYIGCWLGLQAKTGIASA